MNAFMRFPGGKCKAFTMSYDDGVQQDVKLISIMRKNGVKGTFNLNSGVFAAEGTVYPEGQIHRRMTLNECKKAYAGEDIEVAVHGLTHPFLEQLSRGECTKEILEDRINLEREFGCMVRGSAYPFGTTNDNVVESLKACGIAYARTVVSTHAFGIPSDWLRLPATCHHNDALLNELGDKFLALRSDRGAYLFYLWGHAYEFEANDNWNVIEEFLAKIGHKDDVWYATNIEIYDYVKAFEQLIFSADGLKVYNPTATELWLERGRTVYKIGAGETITF